MKNLLRMQRQRNEVAALDGDTPVEEGAGAVVVAATEAERECGAGHMFFAYVVVLWCCGVVVL